MLSQFLLLRLRDLIKPSTILWRPLRKENYAVQGLLNGSINNYPTPTFHLSTPAHVSFSLMSPIWAYSDLFQPRIHASIVYQYQASGSLMCRRLVEIGFLCRGSLTVSALRTMTAWSEGDYGVPIGWNCSLGLTVSKFEQISTFMQGCAYADASGSPKYSRGTSAVKQLIRTHGPPDQGYYDMATSDGEVENMGCHLLLGLGPHSCFKIHLVLLSGFQSMWINSRNK